LIFELNMLFIIHQECYSSHIW